LELGLTRTAKTDTTDALPGKVGPHAGQARQTVLQLRQLDLETPLVRLRATREDVEDERRSVDHLELERLLEVALLRRGEVAVDEDHVVVQLVEQLHDLLQLALADEGGRMRMTKLLDHRAHDLDVDRLGEARQLLEGILRRPRLVLRLDGNEKRPLLFGSGFLSMKFNIECYDSSLSAMRCARRAQVLYVVRYETCEDWRHPPRRERGISGGSAAKTALDPRSVDHVTPPAMRRGPVYQAPTLPAASGSSGGKCPLTPRQDRADARR